MRKIVSMVFSVLLLMILAGCTSLNYETDVIPDFNFPTPSGYILSQETEMSVQILKNGQSIGGIRFIGLDASALDERDHTSIHKYLESLGPIPLIPEWMTMNGDNCLYVSMAITDPEAKERTEYSRLLFPHDSALYDLWFFDELVSDEEITAIRKSVYHP